MHTTVLIENAAILIAIGVALHRSRKAVILTALIAVVAHMAFDNTLLSYYDPANSLEDNMNYYFLMSLFFLGMFGLFMAKGVTSSKLSIIMAGCMITQSIFSFLMALNGGTLSGVVIPEFEPINIAHEMFNKGIWIVECIVIYAATTTSDN